MRIIRTKTGIAAARLILRNPSASMALALAGLIIVAVATGLYALFTLVAEIDARAATDARRMIQGALNREVQTAGDRVHITARWDDAVANLYGDLDRRWAASNIGYPMYSYVIDARGGTLFGNDASSRPAPAFAEAAPEAARLLLARLPRTLAEANRRKTGVSFISSFEGRPVVVAAMPVIPFRGISRIPEGAALRYIVYARPIDAALLEGWRTAFAFRQLQLLPAPGAEAEAIPVTAADGRTLGYLTWPAIQPGREAMQRLRPLLFGRAAIILLFTTLLAMLIYRSNRTLRLSSARARSNATSAEQARLDAEAALRETEAARARAFEMAEREAGEQARHQRQLRERARLFADALEQSMATLVESLLRAAGELERSAEVTLSAIQSQRAEAETMKERATQSAATLQGIASCIDDLASTIDDVRRVGEQSRDAVATASTGSVTAREANHRLVDQVSSISAAASQIGGIARQTNLLALNATIEAARAGAEGRGFAIVAQEVKALAHQTGRITADIQDRVEGIEHAARATAALVDDVHLRLEALVKSVTVSSTTVERQQDATYAILSASQGLRDNAESTRTGVTAIADSLDSVAGNAHATRDIGAGVRIEIQHLKSEFDRILSQLRAA